MPIPRLRRLSLGPLPVVALLMLWAPHPTRAATLGVPSAAYPTIQAGIQSAQPGDVVLVADGTYTGPGNVDLDFGGKDITVRSAHGAAATVIDCGGSASAPHRGFFLHGGETAAAVIDGFTVRNGVAPSVSGTDVYSHGPAVYADGGGIYSGGGATVTGCTVSGCTAAAATKDDLFDAHAYGRGGGIYSGSGVVTGCTVTACTAAGTIIPTGSGMPGVQASGEGGGIYCGVVTPLPSGVLTGLPSGIVTGCTVSTCATQGDGGGGGIAAVSATVTGCTVSGCSSADGGGGIDASISSTVSGCTVSACTADYDGGGIFSNSLITDCVIVGNTAGEGGGVAGTAITNCTVADNTSYGFYGGVGAYVNTACTNCILWGNHHGTTVGRHASVPEAFCDDDALLTGGPDEGNFSADPLFVDPAGGDYRLQPGSPCLGTGTPVGAAAADRDGNPRPDPPSIGAYQYAPRPLFWTAAALSVGPDGVSHLLWDETGGEAALWRLTPSGTGLDQQHFGPFPAWTVRSVATGPDGFTHVLAVNASGEVALWRLDAQNRYVDEQHYGPFYSPDSVWRAAALSVGPDNVVRLAWTFPTGEAAVWRLDAQNGYLDQQHYGPFYGDSANPGTWALRSLATGPDNVTRLAWASPGGEIAVWRLDAGLAYLDQAHFGPFQGWTFRSLSAGSGNITRLVWTNTSGEAAFWRLDAQNGYLDQQHYGPFPGWSARALAAAPDGGARALWVNITGEIALWRLDGGNGYRDEQHYGPY